MKKLLIAALLAATLISCSKDEQLELKDTTFEFSVESPALSRVLVITSDTSAIITDKQKATILKGSFVSVTNLSRYHVYVIINGRSQVLLPTTVNLDIRPSDIQSP